MMAARLIFLGIMASALIWLAEHDPGAALLVGAVMLAFITLWTLEEWA